jgi:hypothetical protein
MLRQYYWCCNSCTANRRSAANKQKSAKTTYWRCECALLRLAAPKGAESAPRFAYKCRAQRSAINISCAVYIEPILLRYVARTASPIFQNSPITWAVLTRNRNIVKPRLKLNKTTKECPAPQSKAPTLLLTPFLTHLSFR